MNEREVDGFHILVYVVLLKEVECSGFHTRVMGTIRHTFHRVDDRNKMQMIGIDFTLVLIS